MLKIPAGYVREEILSHKQMSKLDVVTKRVEEQGCRAEVWLRCRTERCEFKIKMW